MVPNMNDKDTSGVLSAAERELGAFLTTVRRSFGADAVRRASVYWMDALEQFDAAGCPDFDWRKVTIAAASRLASEPAPAQKPFLTTRTHIARCCLG